MVRSHVPPDLLAVIDAAGLHQQLDEALEGLVALEFVGNSGSREALEDLRPHAHESAAAPEPEGRTGRERKQVRKKIPNLILQGDRDFFVFNADVHVQTEDQVRAGDVLQVLDDRVISLIRADFLRLPVAERMGRRRHDAQPALPREAVEFASHLDEFAFYFGHVAAHVRSDFDHRLVHLHTTALAKHAFPIFQEARDVALQLARFRVDSSSTPRVN